MSDKKKIALLSNITVDLIVAKLSRKYNVYIPEGFDTWVQEIITPSSRLYCNSFESIVVLLDGTESRSWCNSEEGFERINLWKQAVTTLVNNKKNVPIFVSTIDIRENRIKSLSERKYSLEIENEWYQFIQEQVEKNNNVYVFDIVESIIDIGRNNFYSNKMWYMSSMPYSRDGLNLVSNELDRVLASVFDSRKKIIAVDLDNTLWGGVVGEDGIDGIELSDHKEGQRYYDFQRQLLEMKNRGVLLGIVSKNNLEDAEKAINSHPAMILSENDFVSRKINWDNKAINLKVMEKELNITEGGFVFIDDNPVERETVKGECPEILVPDFPEDTTELISFAEEIWCECCRPLRVLGEDVNKTQMYQLEAKRKHDMETSLNLDEYIKKLEMVVDIHRMKTDEKERTVQLIGKTNQFNVTTKRYTTAEIDQIESGSNNSIYVVRSSDKYGDNGLISVVILKEIDGQVNIDSFLMSCRVMGRKLEDVIINEILDKYRKKFIAEYIPTEKNAPVKDLYDRLGFELISEDNNKIYEFDASDYKKKNYDYYKEIKFEE